MLWIWWPGFVVPACMVLGGLGWKYIRRLPYRRKEKLSPDAQKHVMVADARDLGLGEISFSLSSLNLCLEP